MNYYGLYQKMAAFAVLPEMGRRDPAAGANKKTSPPAARNRAGEVGNCIIIGILYNFHYKMYRATTR